MLVEDGAVKRTANEEFKAVRIIKEGIIVYFGVGWRLALHLPWLRWPFRAVVRVKTVPQYGHSGLAESPAFSR